MALHSTRRSFLRNVATVSAALPALHLSARSKRLDEEVDWYNVEDWGIEGKGWTDTLRYYDRFPSKAEGSVREAVWNLSRQSAGMNAHFSSDSPSIHVRYSLFSDRIAMPHMPATGVSGVDLYARDDQGNFRWLAVSRPEEQEVEAEIAKELAPGMREYRAYLPLYNGIESLEIGVAKGSTFSEVSPREQRPIVFYGTSIMHGACASRPGMAFPSILGRRLDLPIINLAFSGNGRMEPEVGALLAELDPIAFAIDCLPNMNGELVSERAGPLVQQIKAAHPDTPVLLVEDRTNTNTPFFPQRRDHHTRNRLALRKTFQQLQDKGLDDLYYLQGEHLLGLDGEGATDGSHPSDLGMMRYADAYEPALRGMLGRF